MGDGVFGGQAACSRARQLSAAVGKLLEERCWVLPRGARAWRESRACCAVEPWREEEREEAEGGRADGGQWGPAMAGLVWAWVLPRGAGQP